MTLYATGTRRTELHPLKLADIDSRRFSATSFWLFCQSPLVREGAILFLPLDSLARQR